MLQACVPNVSSVFQKHVESVFILGVAIWMLHMFYNGLSSVFLMFLQMFQTHVLSVSFAFGHMLQMLQIDVSK